MIRPPRDIAGILSAVSAAAVALSVVHELEYYKVIGPKFQAFMSLADYLTAALDWLPLLIFPFIFDALWGAWFREGRANRPGSQSALAPETSQQEQHRRRSAKLLSAKYLFPFAGIGLLILLVAGTWVWRLLIAIGWLVFCVLIFQWKPAGQRMSAFSFNVLAFAPLAIAMAALYGNTDAHNDLRLTRHIYVLQAAAPEQSGPVVVLRNLQKGVLVHSPSRKTNDFIRWEDVRMLSKVSDYKEPRSVACILFDFPCYGAQEPTPEI